MKTKLVTLLLLLTAFGAHAQFRRSSDHKVYAFTNTLRSNDVFVIGRITPDTNYNYAVSNLWTLVTNTATYFSTNAAGISASTATNIAAYQAFLATNNYASTVSNIANYYITIATNNLAPTNTGIAGQVLHVSVTGGATKWDYVNQTLTNSNPVVPDFNLPVNYWVTNAAFLFLAPANVETTGLKLQVTDCIVTNSTAAAVAVTFPGSIHVTGTAFVTNLSVFHFRQFAGKWTNCACEPVW
jgi:hypothetical protein